jgi:hypothetical protein
MPARRIAVLVGSHDPVYFARDTQPDRPSQTAVRAALRTHPSRSEASHCAASPRIPAHDGRSIARNAGARVGIGSRRAPGGAGPPRLRAVATASTRRPVPRAREPTLARAMTGA